MNKSKETPEASASGVFLCLAKTVWKEIILLDEEDYGGALSPHAHFSRLFKKKS